MSSSIAIPKRKKNQRADMQAQSPTSSSSSSLSSSAGSPRTPDAAPSPAAREPHHRRPSLLSSSISRSEHIVINVGEPDAPRLITCVKASQGFDWNQEIFLPSYADRDYSSDNLERKQDPVEDIILTDEEAASILPQ